MTFNLKAAKGLARLGAVVCWAALALRASAGPSAETALGQFIQAQPELYAVFGGSAINPAGPGRASASAAVGSARHAVVLYQGLAQGGEQWCHAALTRPERAAWLGQLQGLANNDDPLAQALAQARTVKTTLRHAEYHSITAPAGWMAGVCAVRLENLTYEWPPLPDQAMVHAALYGLGKQLFAAGQPDQALARFKALKADERLYPNALLFIIAILDTQNPSIADALRHGHVQLARVTDADALAAYSRSSVARGLLVEDARATGSR